MRHLGYSWSEAHEDAHILEHCAPRRMVERLDQFLQYPVYCPHGEAIPRKNGPAIEKAALHPLTEVSVGRRACIRKVIEEKELLDYLQGLGLSIGKEVIVKQREPYEGPLAIQMNGRECSISYKAASKILVEDMSL